MGNCMPNRRVPQLPPPYPERPMNPRTDPRAKRPPARIAGGILLAVLALLATACGGGDADASTDEGGLVFQGAQNVDVPATTTSTTAAPADDASAGAGEGGGVPTFDETQDTIPTDEEEDPDGEFFDAVGDFMACLSTEGFGFIGIPNGDDATAPVNDPGYREALGSCAASTQILSKMEAAEDTSDLTAEEIEENNRAFGVFVDCLIGRGWTIPAPTPDENGVLQPPYIEIARDWTPPGGGSIIDDDSFNTDDFGECGFTQDALN